jgi:hypothetical protein
VGVGAAFALAVRDYQRHRILEGDTLTFEVGIF